MIYLFRLLLLTCCVLSSAWPPTAMAKSTQPICQQQASTPPSRSGLVPVSIPYTIAARYPHRTDAFSQGLIYREGYIYESTGLYGQSSISKIKLGETTALIETALKETYFGEGLTQYNNEFIQLTWKSGDVLRYTIDTAQPQGHSRFQLNKVQKIEGEGWGVTFDGSAIITSNGSAQLTYRDPETLKPQKLLDVTAIGRPLKNLNELEWVDGCLYANIWRSDTIAVIDPNSGNATHTIDLSPIAQKERKLYNVDVANGIAYRPENGNLLVTGKNWRFIYELELR